MVPLSPGAVEVRSKTKALAVADWTIRQSRREDEEDSGWRFEAILRNESSRAFKDVESELRYFDSRGKFIGVDEGFSISNELAGKEDKTVSISITVPSDTRRAVFLVKASHTNFLEKHSFLLFGVALLLSAVLFLFAGLFKK
jgi:hypothetical protein